MKRSDESDSGVHSYCQRDIYLSRLLFIILCIIMAGKSRIQQEGDSFHQKIGLKFKEETSEMSHLEQSIVWC